MNIDCHGHYTTAPQQHEARCKQQIAALADGVSPPPRLVITFVRIDHVGCVSAAR